MGMKIDWCDTPDHLKEDPIVASLELERLRALQSLRNLNDCLQRYVDANSDPDNMPRLTITQEKVLDFIVDRYTSKSESPSYAEIANMMKWASVNSAVSAVKILIKKGYIIKDPRKWRSISPVFTKHKERITKLKT